MRELRTEITIKARPEEVWTLLTDFENYPNWNPFIRSIKGNLIEGAKLAIVIQNPEMKPMDFKPTCTKVERDKEFRWLGHLYIPGIFDGEHIFEVNIIDNDTVNFIQRENFKGLISPFLFKLLEPNTRKGFELMNKKMKEILEER